MPKATTPTARSRRSKRAQRAPSTRKLVVMPLQGVIKGEPETSPEAAQLTITIPSRSKPSSTASNRRNAWKHPDELEYIRPKDWDEDQIISFLCKNGFSIPPRTGQTINPWCKITNREGEEIMIPRGYRVPLMFVAKFQWDSLRLVLTSATRDEEWEDYKFDILHVSRLCTLFLDRARDAMKCGMDKSWRCPTFDRALVRYYRRWLVNREEFLRDFWLEYQDEEYQRDVLKSDWNRFVLKGHKGFHLTRNDLENGLTFDELTHGLSFLRGRLNWDTDPRSLESRNVSRSAESSNLPNLHNLSDTKPKTIRSSTDSDAGPCPGRGSLSRSPSPMQEGPLVASASPVKLEQLPQDPDFFRIAPLEASTVPSAPKSYPSPVTDNGRGVSDSMYVGGGPAEAESLAAPLLSEEDALKMLLGIDPDCLPCMPVGAGEKSGGVPDTVSKDFEMAGVEESPLSGERSTLRQDKASNGESCSIPMNNTSLASQASNFSHASSSSSHTHPHLCANDVDMGIIPQQTEINIAAETPRADARSETRSGSMQSPQSAREPNEQRSPGERSNAWDARVHAALQRAQKPDQSALSPTAQETPQSPQPLRHPVIPHPQLPPQYQPPPPLPPPPPEPPSSPLPPPPTQQRHSLRSPPLLSYSWPAFITKTPSHSHDHDSITRETPVRSSTVPPSFDLVNGDSSYTRSLKRTSTERSRAESGQGSSMDIEMMDAPSISHLAHSPRIYRKRAPLSRSTGLSISQHRRYSHVTQGMEHSDPVVSKVVSVFRDTLEGLTDILASIEREHVSAAIPPTHTNSVAAVPPTPLLPDATVVELLEEIKNLKRQMQRNAEQKSDRDREVYQLQSQVEDLRRQVRSFGSRNHFSVEDDPKTPGVASASAPVFSTPSHRPQIIHSSHPFSHLLATNLDELPACNPREPPAPAYQPRSQASTPCPQLPPHGGIPLPIKSQRKHKMIFVPRQI